MIFNRNFEPRLSRKCSNEVTQLRDNWDRLLATSEKVYLELIREKRGIYEQELDKQVKVKAFWKQFLSYLVSTDFYSQMSHFFSIFPLVKLCSFTSIKYTVNCYVCLQKTVSK